MERAVSRVQAAAPALPPLAGHEGLPQDAFRPEELGTERLLGRLAGQGRFEHGAQTREEHLGWNGSRSAHGVLRMRPDRPEGRHLEG
jgi:hypothetical protein